jgi:hypothetical protein
MREECDKRVVATMTLTVDEGNHLLLEINVLTIGIPIGDRRL